MALRNRRVRPQRDDKVLTGWNALMISALARGGRILQDRQHVEAAVRAAQFIWTRLRDEGGRLLARYRDGDAAFPAYLDDYAFLIRAVLDLYDADMRPLWLERAVGLQAEQDRLFWDAESGGYYFYGSDAEDLLARPKKVQDGAVPSGNAVAAVNLLKLSRLTGDEEHAVRGGQLLRSFAGEVSEHPSAHTQSLAATLLALFPGPEVVVASGREPEELRRELRPLARVFAPDAALLYRLEGDEYSGLDDLAPFTAGMGPRGGQTTYYICRDRACREPTTDLSRVLAEMGS
ncbi:MAG: hypothetical protein R6U70_01155 [Bacillota bacterium]